MEAIRYVDEVVDIWYRMMNFKKCIYNGAVLTFIVVGKLNMKVKCYRI